jgi:hypothetical protein
MSNEIISITNYPKPLVDVIGRHAARINEIRQDCMSEGMRNAMPEYARAPESVTIALQNAASALENAYLTLLRVQTVCEAEQGEEVKCADPELVRESLRVAGEKLKKFHEQQLRCDSETHKAARDFGLINGAEVDNG